MTAKGAIRALACPPGVMGTGGHGRSGRETAAVRPVAIPADFDRDDETKADGMVELPQHIRWSGPPRTYDLGDPHE